MTIAVTGANGSIGGQPMRELAAAARAITRAGSGATYDLTGPEALSMTDVAASLSRVSGREVTFLDETVEQAYASRAHFGAPAFEVDGWVSTYVAIAKGETAGVSGDVLAVTGHDALAFDYFLAENPSTWAHLLRR